MTGDPGWFYVRAEAWAPGGQRPVPINDIPADALMELLEPHHGIVSCGGRLWSVAVSVEEPDLVQAVAAGTGIIMRLAQQAGMPQWPLVRVEAMRDDVLNEEISRPAPSSPSQVPGE